MKEVRLPDYIVAQGQKDLPKFVIERLKKEGFDLSKPYTRTRDLRTNIIIFTQEEEVTDE
jgi:hypothetical protein